MNRSTKRIREHRRDDENIVVADDPAIKSGRSNLKHQGLVFFIGVVVASLTGCSMCCGPHDYDYPTFGGKHQRADPQWGRVGSPFSDPFVAVGPSADSNLKPHESETNPEELPGDPDGELEDLGPTNGGSEGDLPDPNLTPNRSGTDEDDASTYLRRSIDRALNNAKQTGRWR